MFTNNYKNYRKAMFFNDKTLNFKNYSGVSQTLLPQSSFYGDIGAVIKYGQCRTFSGSTSYYGSAPSSVSGTYSGVWFGKDSTPPAESDYTLGDPITSGLSITNSTPITMDNGDGVYVVQSSYILTNTSVEDITINEIGLFGELPWKDNNNYYYSVPVLFERTVLAEPITIPAGEAKLITYKLTFNH